MGRRAPAGEQRAPAPPVHSTAWPVVPGSSTTFAPGVLSVNVVRSTPLTAASYKAAFPLPRAFVIKVNARLPTRRAIRFEQTGERIKKHRMDRVIVAEQISRAAVCRIEAGGLVKSETVDRLPVASLVGAGMAYRSHPA